MGYVHTVPRIPVVVNSPDGLFSTQHPRAGRCPCVSVLAGERRANTS
jgi:hypothetical protein